MAECCAIDLMQIQATDTRCSNNSAVKTGKVLQSKDFLRVLKDAGCRIRKSGADKGAVIAKKGKTTAGADYDKDCGETRDTADDADAATGMDLILLGVIPLGVVPPGIMPTGAILSGEVQLSVTAPDVDPFGVAPFDASQPGELAWLLSQLREEEGMAGQIEGDKLPPEGLPNPAVVTEQINDVLASLVAENGTIDGGMAEADAALIQAEDLPPGSQGTVPADKTNNVWNQEEVMPEEAGAGENAGTGLAEGKEISREDMLFTTETGETAARVKDDSITGYAKQADEIFDGEAGNKRLELHEKQGEDEPATDDRAYGYTVGNAAEKSRRDGNTLTAKKEHRWTTELAEGYKAPDEAGSAAGSSNQIRDVRSTGSYGRMNESVMKQVLDNIAMNARVVIGDDKTEMFMNLKPDSLGKLSLKVVSENGIINAEIIAENQQVKEILESNMQLLKDTLEGQGIPVEGFSVSVGGDSHSDRWSNESMFKRSRRHDEIELPVAARDVSQYGKGWTRLYMRESGNIDLMA